MLLGQHVALVIGNADYCQRYKGKNVYVLRRAVTAFLLIWPSVPLFVGCSSEQVSEEIKVRPTKATSQDTSEVERLKAQLEVEEKKLDGSEATRDTILSLGAEDIFKIAQYLAQNPMDEREESFLFLKSELTAPDLQELKETTQEWVEKLGEMVHVSDYGFYIDKYEVTNAQYAIFLNEWGNQTEEGTTWLDEDEEGAWAKRALIEERDGRFKPRAGYDDHPVVEVNWFGSKAYCEWAGKRLPTEEEWQQACQGTADRIYPWGNRFFTGNANTKGRGDGYDRTAPVGSFPQGASPYGVMDMSGNVWEWTATETPADRHNFYDQRILRGGSHGSDGSRVQCEKDSYFDRSPTMSYDTAGFRCAAK